MLRRLLGLVLLERSLRNSERWKEVAHHWEGVVGAMAETASRMHNEEMLAVERAMLEMAVAWRVSMEQPENDLRDEVEQIIRTMSDEIARREEHVA